MTFAVGSQCSSSHGWIELGLVCPRLGRRAVAAADLVAEHEEQQILVRHLLLARQGQAIGKGIQHAAEFEPAQHGDQIGRERIARTHERAPAGAGVSSSGSWLVTWGATCRAYWRGSRR